MNILPENQRYSVLMSIYDKETPAFFDESIKSMLAQTVLPEQIVIVEDGPINENLTSIISKYIAEYSDLFTVVTISANNGLANALNEGLKACRNELVARMDTDDISLPSRCKRQLSLFQNHPELSLIGTNIDEFIDDPDKIISSRVVPSEESEILKFSRRRNPFNHPTVMFRKSDVMRMGGYNVKRRRAQDFELFTSMIHEGCRATNINESLLKFRYNENSFERRKTWSHCMAYVQVVYTFWRMGYSSLGDLILVFCGQAVVHFVPQKIMKFIFNSVLRKQK